MTTTDDLIAAAEAHSAHTYHPLPVVVASAEGAWMTDVEGRRLSWICWPAYSALNFGHGNRRLIEAAKAQLERVTLTSRAFHHDRFGAFCAQLAELCGMEMVLPMNTGAEAVETAVKTARKWGYRVKGVPAEMAKIVVAGGNFHGRTTTVISFSTDPEARADYGPYTPGFEIVPYGDLTAMRQALTENTVAVLIEPIQGEAGVVVPPGDLPGVRELTRERNVLLVADEIQSGLGRTGRTFACEHEGVVPDAYLLGKALGGGIVPVSAVVSSAEVLGVFRPGEHGSTFGGNPLACAVALEVIAMLRSGEYQARAAELGGHLHRELAELAGTGRVTQVRGRGLWAGVDVHPRYGTGRELSEKLMDRGVLVKDTHGTTLRIAPPLVISQEDLDWGLARLREVLDA
ncbi:ornithine aminotransferase OS=Streptomyces glaucescens OX=1907 GN=rocD2 PE=3 SV=1 [Streptomyces glaucescens]